MSYQQCTLVRTPELGGNLSETVTHIPSKLAIKGKFVELKEKDGKWNTWQVLKVSNKIISDEQAKNLHNRWHKGWNNNI